jgi:hypothetical protein
VVVLEMLQVVLHTGSGQHRWPVVLASIVGQ